MRVGLVRNVALGLVALVGLGLVGCDDKPTDFGSSDTVRITTNPSAMTVPAGVTALLQSRTENEGAEPTWEEISASVDGSCGSGAITVAEAATYEPSIQPPGQFDVTGGTTWGATCVQLSGGGADATVDVMVVADSLELTGTPANDQLVVFQQVQLGANLLANDGSAVGPFDATTDLTWSSDDEAVLTVDDTGLVTAEGAGSATITATWTEFGVDVSAETTITVVVPAPVLTSTDVASASAGEVVTVTGTGLIPGAHIISVDGFAVIDLLEPMVVDATTATFRMPPGANGDVDITIGVAGEESDPIAVTRTGDTEPANDDFSVGAPPAIGVPIDLWGSLSGADLDDYFEFTLAAPTTIHFFMEWEGSSGDFDLLQDLAGRPFAFPCGFPTATGNVPEEGDCTLPPGTYLLWVDSYDGGDGVYHITGEIVP